MPVFGPRTAQVFSPAPRDGQGARAGREEALGGLPEFAGGHFGVECGQGPARDADHRDELAVRLFGGAAHSSVYCAHESAVRDSADEPAQEVANHDSEAGAFFAPDADGVRTASVDEYLPLFDDGDVAGAAKEYAAD